MRKRRVFRWREERGVSLVEILVGVLILSVAILGLAGAGAVAARHVNYGRNDMLLWLAVGGKVEDLVAAGYSGVTTDSAFVQGYPMRWTVTGTDPKKVTLIVQRQNLSGAAVEDTLILYVSDPSKL
jgi:Tfp pilus assembly protein PilV